MTCFLVIGSSLSACQIWNKNRQNSSNTLATKDRSNPELERQYETELRTALEPMWGRDEVGAVKDDVLALRAPAKYLDLHLRVVLALDRMEQESDDSRREGRQELESLSADYTWLR